MLDHFSKCCLSVCLAKKQGTGQKLLMVPKIVIFCFGSECAVSHGRTDFGTQPMQHPARREHYVGGVVAEVLITYDMWM